MNNKQRAYLSGLASKMSPIVQIGKSSLTPEIIQAVDEALEARELIKISVLKNCFDDIHAISCRCRPFAPTHCMTPRCCRCRRWR